MSQTDFRAALLDPDLPAPNGLTDPQGRPAGRRFDVYRNNVSVSLTEALRTAFPVIRQLVGDEFFSAMAAVFLRAHPPQSPLMMFYGAEMPEFLATFEPVSHLGYLPDIARLELALRHSYHAADATPVPTAALETLPPDQFVASRLEFVPAIRLIRSKWPVHAIWQANTRGGPKPVPQAEDVLIARPEFDPDPMLLPQGAGDFIAALMDGQTVGDALEAAGQFDLTATLGLLIRCGALARIIPGELS